MSKRPNPYTRCKKCKQLVLDAANCANCAAKAENPYGACRPDRVSGKRSSVSLDWQEGNWEEWN